MTKFLTKKTKSEVYIFLSKEYEETYKVFVKF